MIFLKNIILFIFITLSVYGSKNDDISYIFGDLQQKLNTIGSFKAVYLVENIKKNIIDPNYYKLEIIFNQNKNFLMGTLENSKKDKITNIIFDTSNINKLDTSFKSYIIQNQKEGTLINYPLSDFSTLSGFYIKILEKISKIDYRAAFINEFGLSKGIILYLNTDEKGLNFSANTTKPKINFTGSWLDINSLKEVKNFYKKDGVLYLYFEKNNIEIVLNTGLLLKHSHILSNGDIKRIRLVEFLKKNDLKNYAEIIPEFYNIEKNFEKLSNRALVHQFTKNYLLFLIKNITQKDINDFLKDKVLYDMAVKQGIAFIEKNNNFMPEKENLDNFLNKILIPLYLKEKNHTKQISFETFINNLKTTITNNYNLAIPFVEKIDVENLRKEIIKESTLITADFSKEQKDKIKQIENIGISAIVEGIAFGLLKNILNNLQNTPLSESLKEKIQRQ